MGTLVCTVELSKKPGEGIKVTIDNEGDGITQTIQMDGTSVTITVKKGEEDTSSYTQTATSVSIKCKTFEVTADETITMTSTKASTYKSGDALTVESSEDLTLKSTGADLVATAKNITATAETKVALAMEDNKLDLAAAGVTLKGGKVAVTSDAMLTVTSDGPATFKGAITGARRAFQLEIRLSARGKPKGAVGLDFYVLRQADYRASVALHVALQRHAQGVVALFDDSTDEVPCAVQFGPRAPTQPADDGDSRHPLARMRSFFHFPEQDLYVCVDVPDRPWNKLTLRFTLDADWPEEQRVSSDSLRLHVVPAVNSWVDFTAPILHDGTRAVVPLQSATVTREAAMATSVRGVYQVDRAMAPLLPLALGNQGDGYEVIRPSDGGPPRLRIRLSDALGKPRKLLADVVWSQPRDQAEPSSLVIQVYLFCLDEGFGGRYADDPERLKEYRRQLFKMLEAKPPPGPLGAPQGCDDGQCAQAVIATSARFMP